MNVLYENVPESILFIVMICGIAFIGMVCTLVIVTIEEIIADGIRKWKINYKIRHRFDKQPTAKCYCIDCAWRWDDGTCGKFEKWKVADNWFCWDAKPKKR